MQSCFFFPSSLSFLDDVQLGTHAAYFLTRPRGADDGWTGGKEEGLK